MSSSVINRKKDSSDLTDATTQEETTNETDLFLNPDPELASPSTIPTEDDDNKTNSPPSAFTRVIVNRIKNMSTLSKLTTINVILFFVFIIALPAHEKAKHYKRVHIKLKEITKTVHEQTETLSKKSEALSNIINSESDSLVEKMYELAGAVSNEHHEKELAEKQGHIGVKHEQIKGKQLEIDLLKSQIERHKKELDEVKLKIGRNQDKVDHFCKTCLFTTGKVVTTCYRQMQFVRRDSTLTTDYEAMAAVIELDPKCTKV